jgi:hypothetical protein
MKKLKVVFYKFYSSFAWRILIGSYIIAIVGGLGWFAYDQYDVQRVMLAEVNASQTRISELMTLAEEYEN